MEKNQQELFGRISQKYGVMSKGQKKLANYITSNYEKAVFMTAAKLGQTVAVSESTVVRFAVLLGYEGFPELHKALEEVVQNRLEIISKIEISEKNENQENILEAVMLSDAEKIKRTLQELSKEAFYEAADNILGARRIYIIGLRNCASLASFLGFYLNIMLQNVAVISTGSANEIFEQMLNIGEEDVVIGISFPRYSMHTIKAMEFANDRRAKVISITDNRLSPLNLYSSCNLLARSEMATLLDSLAAPLSVINALIVTIYMKKPELVTGNLEMLDKIWEDYQIYANDEMNFLKDEMNMIEYEGSEGL